MAGLGDALDGFRRRFRVQRLAVQQAGMALDHREQVVEFMRDSSGQAAHSFELLGLAQLSFELQVVRHVLHEDQEARPGLQHDRLRP